MLARSASSDRAVWDADTVEEIQRLIQEHAGFHTPPRLLAALQRLLTRRLDTLELESVSAYAERLRRDPAELDSLAEGMANHNTRFFRESEQYTVLRRVLADELRTAHEPKLRIWCAGCSTGEEPFTMAMLIRLWYPDAADRIRILGTDLSRNAVRTAREARYPERKVAALPPSLRSRFCAPSRASEEFEIVPEIRRMVRLARLNLMDPWPMRRRFHVIFCRNVLIYFDAPTQQRLLRSLRDQLETPGYLFLGQAEAVPAGFDGLRMVAPSVYDRWGP